MDEEVDDSDFEEDWSNDTTYDETDQVTLSDSADLEEAEHIFDVRNINIHDDDEPNDTDGTINQTSDGEDEICNDIQQPERHPRRNLRPPTKLYVASTAKSSLDRKITTSDGPTLTEAMSATPKECDFWTVAIEEQFKSLEKK